MIGGPIDPARPAARPLVFGPTPSPVSSRFPLFRSSAAGRVSVFFCRHCLAWKKGGGHVCSADPRSCRVCVRPTLRPHHIGRLTGRRCRPKVEHGQGPLASLAKPKLSLSHTRNLSFFPPHPEPRQIRRLFDGRSWQSQQRRGPFFGGSRNPFRSKHHGQPQPKCRRRPQPPNDHRSGRVVLPSSGTCATVWF